MTVVCPPDGIDPPMPPLLLLTVEITESQRKMRGLCL
jgi:hypothetical protein